MRIFPEHGGPGLVSWSDLNTATDPDISGLERGSESGPLPQPSALLVSGVAQRSSWSAVAPLWLPKPPAACLAWLERWVRLTFLERAPAIYR
jgi:hypothetical protein